MKKLILALAIGLTVSTANALDLTLGVGKCRTNQGPICEKVLGKIELSQTIYEYELFDTPTKLDLKYTHYSNTYDGFNGYGVDIPTLDWTVNLF